MTVETIEVELDSRQRLPLARVVSGDQHRFRIERLPGGELLLTPVISVSEHELALLRNPQALARLERGLAEAAEGKGTRHRAGHFQDLAAESGPEEDG